MTYFLTKLKPCSIALLLTACFAEGGEDLFKNKPSMSLQQMKEHVSEISIAKYDLVLLIPLKAFGNEETKFNSDFYVFEGNEIDEFMGALKVDDRFAKPLPPDGMYYGLVGVSSNVGKEKSKVILYLHSEGVIIFDDGGAKFSLDAKMLKVLSK